MRPQSIISPEDQNVTFVELFFDLVFVFLVTQVVGLFHDGLDWGVAGQALLVFWLVWWAWTQFTWTLNAADTTQPLIQLGALLATAVAFFMAVALPNSFDERAPWFAVTYVIVRVIGLAIQALVYAEDPDQQVAVRNWIAVSLVGLVAVLTGGFAGGALQLWFWGVAILLDVIAAAISGQAEGWNVHPEHFAERHGLIVIIALGESLIVAAGQVTGEVWTGDLIAVAVLVVAISCGLWWSYFPRNKPALEHALKSTRGAEQTRMARDAFSLLHFPMLCGVIAYAFVVEEVVAHPGQPLLVEGRLALAVGLALFVGGLALVMRRATGRLPVPRLVIVVGASVAVVAVSGASGLVNLAIALAGVVAVAAAEQRAGSVLE